MSVETLIADPLIDDSRPPIIAILGTTGSGKTSVAMDMPTSEVVCADRFTAWAEMDLGVAKPTSEERSRVPHHLVNVFHLGELADHTPRPGFAHLGGRHELPVMRNLALAAIDNIAARGRVPIIVGGSAPALSEITLGSVREEIPEFKTWLDNASEEDLRRHCDDWGFPFFEYFNPLEAVKRKVYAEHTKTGERHPLPNVYPIGVKHDMNRLIHRIQDRLDQMWDEGLPDEVERLVDTYGWVRPLAEAIGYKEFRPDSNGIKPRPDKVRRTILANTIGFVWSQSEELGNMIPVRWAKSPEHAVQIGQWVIEQWQTKGLQASRTFYYPWTLTGQPRERSV